MGRQGGLRGWSLVVALVLVISVMGQNEFGENRAAVEEVAKSNTLFTTSLYNALKPSNPGNLIFSPFSLSAVLAMLKPGARGTTGSEIRAGLKFPDDQTLYKGYSALLDSLKSNDNFTLETANRIYSSAGFELNPSYVQIVKESFHATVEQLDFSKGTEAAGKINGWVEEQTRQKIKDLISPTDLNSLTRLVLVNAIYFKGLWKNKFEPRLTHKAPFFLSAKDGDSVDVDMMKIEGEFPYAEITELSAKAVALPYQGDRLSMIVILPNAKDGLADLESKLESFNLADLPGRLQNRKIELQMPKFKLESTIDLKDPLTKLGMGSMFDPKTADFSGIPKVAKSEDGLYVSKAVQKAFIEVNEEGSEAAAATVRLRFAPIVNATTNSTVQPHAHASARGGGHGHGGGHGGHSSGHHSSSHSFHGFTGHGGSSATTDPSSFQISTKSAFTGARFRVDRPFVAYIHDELTKVTLFATTLRNPTNDKTEVRSLSGVVTAGEIKNGASAIAVPALLSLFVPFLLRAL